MRRRGAYLVVRELHKVEQDQAVGIRVVPSLREDQRRHRTSGLAHTGRGRFRDKARADSRVSEEGRGGGRSRCCRGVAGTNLQHSDGTTLSWASRTAQLALPFSLVEAEQTLGRLFLLLLNYIRILWLVLVISAYEFAFRR